MKNITFLFILTLFLQIPLFLCELEKILPGDYPYSIKLGYEEAVSFINPSYVTIFKVNKLERIINDEEPFDTYNLDDDDPCITTEEKGGIYYDGYYYLSCLDSVGSTSFQIKVYKKKDDSTFERVESDPTHPIGTYNYNSGSSIRFFMVYSSEVLIGVAFLDGNLLRIKQIIKTTLKSEAAFTIENIARDIDCVYVSKYQRLVCAFGILSKGVYTCGLNIFSTSITQIEFRNNLKQFDCQNHHSRKLRLNSDVNENTDFFYYYFVGTDNIAYISKVVMTSASDLEFSNPIEIIKGCSQAQDSFDLAEDKFLGYNVFTCVEYQYKIGRAHV